MSELLQDPFVQSSVLPLLAGLILVGALHLLRRSLAAAGIAAGFLVVFAMVIGLPALPPPSSMGKLFWASAVGLLLGAAADAAGVRGRVASAVLAVWLAASLLWIALPALDSAVAVVTLVILLGTAACVAFARGSETHGSEGGGSEGGGSPTAPAASLLALALAVGGTALIGSSASIAQMALALAASAGAFLLWNWPVERHGWGLSGRVATGIAVLLAAVLALFTQTQAAVLLLALPALLAGHVRRFLPQGDGLIGRAASAAAVTVVAVLPALVAIGAAYALTGGEASPY
ncbi:hypothetical protein J2848_006842 [Azospirillum lipoferum]|uniref:Uncharacterized protein n=1 Tax=Azospirillum lipoferum TaxID=193 RepID=A0A5A9G1X8_AZOLI|nr:MULTISPECIES: hypothetical protein [Azospirillum]KAA0587199.1 hypothetical protein FZ942_34485 [Azospirillum lipoferum]MCP1615129.1 hypothetical protein [Azospirillum lipoferum]MDW5533026.1 hypothetical protein [Azospirillum sp. NL1]